MKIEPGQTYLFVKSGNLVKALAPAAPWRGLPCWTVERTQGSSAGKQMVVLARALERHVKQPLYPKEVVADE